MISNAQIMMAVWYLTENEESTTYRKIESFLSETFKQEVKVDIRKRVLAINKLWNVFQISDGLPTGEPGKPKKRIKLHPDTITYLPTAYVMHNIAKQAEEHRLPIEETRSTTIEAAKTTMGMSETEVKDCFNSLKRVKYLVEKDTNLENPSYALTERYMFEKEYIVGLAQIATERYQNKLEGQSLKTSKETKISN